MVSSPPHALQVIIDQLLASERCGFFTKDRNAKFVGANSFIAQIAGFDHGADMFGKSDDDMPWAADFDRETEREVMSSGKIVHNTQWIHGKTDTFFAHSIKLPIYENNTIVGLVGVIIPFDVSAEAQLIESTEPTMTVAHSYSPRVLVIEDSLLMHQVLRSLLIELQCISTIVTSSQEGLEKVQTGYYDIVLMDLGLPGGQGYEAAKIMSEMGDGKAPTVVGLSSYVDDDVLAQCEAVGIKQTFTKPLMRDKMISVLSQHVYGRSYEHEVTREALRRRKEVLCADPEVLDLVTTTIKLGDQGLMRQYFRMLCTYLPEWLLTVRDLCDRRRLGDLTEVLHRGKGVLSFISAPKLQRRLEALRVRSRGQSQESIDDLYTKLAEEVGILMDIFYRMDAILTENT